jgi:acetyl esterase/lipase
VIYEKLSIRGAQLVIYARDNSSEMDANRIYPTVLICPGGAYGFLSDREAEPVALALLAEGFTAAVLRYGVSGDRHPTQLHQASAAMAYLRENAEQYHVDPQHCFVMGFSAGGHLAAMLGTLWHETPEGETARPNGMVLSYAVLSSGEYANNGSFSNLCGDDAALKARLSLENRVDERTSPAFLWQTATDSSVPSMNSLLMAQSLAKQGIPYALHVFPKGVHGLSLATEITLNPNWPACLEPSAQQWFPLATQWMKDDTMR